MSIPAGDIALSWHLNTKSIKRPHQRWTIKDSFEVTPTYQYIIKVEKDCLTINCCGLFGKNMMRQ